MTIKTTAKLAVPVGTDDDMDDTKTPASSTEFAVSRTEDRDTSGERGPHQLEERVQEEPNRTDDIESINSNNDDDDDNKDDPDAPKCVICYESLDMKREGDNAEKAKDGVMDDNTSKSESLRRIKRRHGFQINPSCRHVACRTCLGRHVDRQMKYKKVPLKCPVHSCGTTLSDNLLQQVKDETFVSQHSNLIQIVQGTAVECTQCAGLVPAATSTDLTCPSCRHVFCKVHGDMHRQQSCQEFQASPAGQALTQQEEQIRHMSQTCTSCGAHLQKTHGCNHVVCGYCHVHYCWGCRTHVYMDQSHGNCRRCQWKQNLAVVGMIALYLVALLVWTPLALVVFIVTLGFGGCFCAGHYGVHLGNEASCSDRWMKGIRSTLAVLLAPCLVMFAEDFFEENYPNF